MPAPQNHNPPAARSHPLTFNVDSVRFHHAWIRTRFPFRYGIASMTQAPHVLAEVSVTCANRSWTGLSAETWVPKWFSKRPDTSYDEDLPDLCRAVSSAASAALQPHRSFAAWWQHLYAAQSDLISPPAMPALLAQMGTAMLERAVLHALTQASNSTFSSFFSSGISGLSPASLRPDLGATSWQQILPAQPLGTLTVRHTVGLSDPLDASDATSPPDDDLPHSLTDNIRAFDLTHFKIKLSGHLETDTHRLLRLAALLPPRARFTLDANENFPDIRVFHDHWNHWNSHPTLARWLNQGLLFIEQPLHRDHSLTDATGQGLAAWDHHPPVIIDEADASLDSLPRALALGYSGTSHKNCKGLVKGLANLASTSAAGAILSGEDLSNIGPVALLQDLAVMNALGIPHVERNGHHYFRGTTMFPPITGQHLISSLPDLFSASGDSGAVLRIHHGALNTAALNLLPLGLPCHTIPAGFSPGLPCPIPQTPPS